MRFIAHRGLTTGPNPATENHPDQIKQCLDNNFDVEIDVRYVNGEWFLGHDMPQYITSLEFLHQDNLWIHCKNFEAAFQLLDLTKRGWNFNFFSHDKDDRTLTSHGFWWTNPSMELGPLSVAVMPEWFVEIDKLSTIKNWNCYGVCSDWIEKIRE